MALEKNLAYDLSLFEEKPREYKQKPNKKNNILKIPQEKLKINARPMAKTLSVLSTAVLSIVSVSVLVIMIYSQVQLTELTENIGCMQKTLNESRSVYTQLQMRVESEMSLHTVEQYAKQNLGMQNTEAYQVEYIELSKGDKASLPTGNSLLSRIKSWF